MTEQKNPFLELLARHHFRNSQTSEKDAPEELPVNSTDIVERWEAFTGLSKSGT